MTSDARTQAALLLTVWLKKTEQAEHRPLSALEWSRLESWLGVRGMSPADLLDCGAPSDVLGGFQDRTVTPDRVTHLLGRAAALGLALDKWERAGLWIASRSGDGYPGCLRKRLGDGAPPILFGCGEKRLLGQGGIAVVGARDADADDLEFTGRLGGEIAGQGYSVVSGGARGVDEAAMLGGLGKEGTVVGILSDSLLRASTSAKYHDSIVNRNLALASPFNPEAGFDVGNAMARNKLIYCLSDAAVVISAGMEKGGTWNGAVENLRQGWVPLFVKKDTGQRPGNGALVAKGAHWLPDGPVNVKTLIRKTGESPQAPPAQDYFDFSAVDSVAQAPMRVRETPPGAEGDAV
ncbi:MAG: DNA-processing protein DprA [Candidatus Hydrogenedens sp.]|nr:DNA-protecting protein DprA [Candidatus Hydrogenedentota bacterium]NLF56941.1 DNA-processing protein DprA [Candidatus Hydrogenedens sp.]